MRAKTEVTRLTKFVSMMTKGTNRLDEMISAQRNPKNMTGLEFQDQTGGEKTEFVKDQRRGPTGKHGASSAW